MEFDVAVRCVEKWQFPKIRGPRNRPQYILNLILGHPQKGTPNFGKSPNKQDLQGNLWDF